ncbi:arabinan endo-1,5-alpha-L-arabinosidase [Chitinophaga sp. XS-30]|uniref:arabinan endo-1,5-alpha-L-arabinosidase n=1 Tax=Chitinophaga sp. XS-30 TaxID=2604421 RepID=UPI0011DDDCDE|nr:arabinan endo-1,5-alpha-L-arabinosidase [Chitinophaga sp. XS-30]QEH42972.1 arabinan endo-1,5-alpha-L-arabinosidase [Chitinophaga sp. XS-30]
MRKSLFILLLLPVALSAQFTARQIRVHDPVMFRQDSTWYLFCTGQGIAVWSSPDMKIWTPEKPVFPQAPEWAVAAVPGYKGHTWAPDISFHNGTWYLFYSVSTFGKNGSCIGLATNKTLHPGSPDFKWTDHGKVLQSVPGRDDWNAIDPNLAFDEQGIPWLSFGSFWSGIKLVKLNPELTAAEGPLFSLASRRPNGNSAIEAPFIFRKDGFYYLFASVDFCCRGERSDYKMIVGRSRHITGPYTDQKGEDLMKGGGTLVLEGDKDWYGVGHNAVCTFDGRDYLVFHGYDAGNRGRACLRTAVLHWEDGWPKPEAQPLLP